MQIKTIALTFGILASFTGFSSQSQALEVGDSAPCVVETSVYPDGSEVEQCIRERNQQQEFLVLTFGSVVCSACAENLPILGSLFDGIREKSEVRLVYSDRNEALIREKLTSHPEHYRFPVALDIEKKAQRAYEIDATPTTFILDKDQHVLFKKVGVLSSDDVQQIRTIVGAN